MQVDITKKHLQSNDVRMYIHNSVVINYGIGYWFSDNI